ncbi:hypothetical protein ACFRAQ_27130 [Nocardia sp. NPDC056611]|uniref:hypothetical protein n=1 Tax=Nocardia sp. NPDC056611 TaxID=3345877 RepID=UPI0036727B89
MVGNWWRNTVLLQLRRSPASAAVLFVVADDGTPVITFPRLNWAWVAIASAAVLFFGITVAMLVSLAYFDEPTSTVPEAPASCEPFCGASTP